MNVTTVDPAPDAPASRRSRRSVNAIPCFEYFVHRSGIIDASTLRGQTSGMVETIANRAWVALSPQQQLDMIVQAREEELRQPATSPPDSDHDVPIVPSPIQIATSNSSSDSVSPEPMMEDNAGITARPGDSNIDASGDSEPMQTGGSGSNDESGTAGISATSTGNSDESTLENLTVLLVEAKAQYKAAEEALKALKDTLKREKRKDATAVADAEKKRNQMKDAMRLLEQMIAFRVHIRSHVMPQSAAPERKPAVRMEETMIPAINEGEYVSVSDDFSPGMNRPKGKGFVVKSRGAGGGTLCDVQYDKPYGGGTHKSVPLKAITPIPLGLNVNSIAQDRRKRTASVASQAGLLDVDDGSKRAKTSSPMQQLATREQNVRLKKTFVLAFR